MTGPPLTIDDRASGGPRASLGTTWRVVSDTVMGGVSQGRLAAEVVDGRACLHLTGRVSLENSGGFLQASLDLATEGYLDASGYDGVEIEVCGNGETYNVHLRTADTTVVWQSYRATFDAPPRWQTVRLPFAAFRPHRLGTPLDVRRLRRIGVVGIGREFAVDLCIGRVVIFRAR